MAVYWLMFFAPVIGALSPGKLGRRPRYAMWLAIGLLFVIIIGLRHEVGGDWGAYLVYYEEAANSSFSHALALNDPGYMAVNWLAGKVGGEIYLVNLICGAITVWGLFSLAWRQPMPWVALSVAVPYLLVVVAMGYTRQSVAIGLVALGLQALADDRIRKFYVYILLAAMFHKTAVIFFVLPLFTVNRHRFVFVLVSILLLLLAWYTLLLDSFEGMWKSYVEEKMFSEGGAIRIIINLVPAILAILFRKRLFEESSSRIWIVLSLLAIVLAPAHSVASTLADRFVLYVTPLQMVVLSRIHRLFHDRTQKTFIVFSLLMVYFLIQLVWLNYAVHAPYWVPYKMYPFFID